VQRRSFVFTKIGAAINRARQPVRVRHLRARSHPRGGFPFARCVVTAFACGRFRPSTRQTTIKRAKRNDSLLVFVPSEASERDASCKSAIISIILPCRLITASCHSLAACHCFFLFRPLPSGGGGGRSLSPDRRLFKSDMGGKDWKNRARQHENRFNPDSFRLCRFFHNAAIKAVIQ